MPLHPPSSRRERILVFGEAGSGKSSTWVSIADWLERTRSKDKVYALDTDAAWEGMRPEDGSLDARVLVSNLDAQEFDPWRPEARRVRGLVSRDDWVVLDMAMKAWRAPQDAYWKAKQGESFADAFAAAVIADDLGELSGHHGTNWGAINKLYADFMDVVLSMPCHVLCVTGTKQLQTEREGKTVRVKAGDKEWEGIGKKPSGQGELSHAFHTIIYCQEKKLGETWTYTTVKERGPIGRPKREYLKGEHVQDFVTTYLIKVAKWRP